MRLRKIKLSGFKSFVDPTTLTVPGNLVGIVGPNGCGKSNIIDAVMWVMGESSAKHLRGDALIDVIFNGSSARNPVGHASVELIFDNTEDKLGGQYASYDEISLKRQINRDAMSTYFLNGTRCRRKDIQAIFLGTGLGPRSYAIIEQGMISRLIEAKPDELRVYIEEAAGISKYRERRRETENRIRHTRENIARLNDIREELDKQLRHLQRQAKAAQRFQALKKDQRQLEAECLALNWKTLKQQSDHEEEAVRKQETRVEAGMSELREIESAIETRRDELAAANEEFNTAQSGFYRIGGEISRLEQKIQHTNEKITTTEKDLEQARRDEQQAREHQQQDEQKLAELLKRKSELEPLLKGSRSESDRAYSYLNESEQAMQAWESEWESFNQAAMDYARKGDLNAARLEHLELNLEDAGHRKASLEKELDLIDLDSLRKQIGEHETQLQEAGQDYAAVRAEYDERQQQLQAARKSAQEQNETLNRQRLDHQRLEGRLASLEALQQSARGEDQPEITAWLNDAGLDNKPRLAQQIQVEKDWTHAVEIVLGEFLQDVCVDDVGSLTESMNAIETGQLGVVESDGGNSSGADGRFESLADKIQGKFPLRYLLARVYIAEDVKAAVALRKQLQADESVITRDGLWIGPNWTRVCRGRDEQAGMLTREQEILSLQDELRASADRLEKLEGELHEAQKTLETAEEELQEVQSRLHARQEAVSEARAEVTASRSKLEQADNRAEQVEAELDDLREQMENDRREYDAINSELEKITGNREELEKQREELVTLREKHRRSLGNAREQWQKTHEESHGIALQLESISSQRASLEQSVKRSQMQIEHLQSRRGDQEHSLGEVRAPLESMQDDLKRHLGEKAGAEKKLGEARSKVQSIENTLREKEQARTTQEQQIQDLRNQLEQIRLETRESRVRLQTIEEKLRESGQDVQQILEELEEGAERDAWREKLEGVTRKIERLGPINLAAIDEFSQLTERKDYLDKQDEDLREALTTLENAIRKIDKESRARFKETFDQLNSNLQETFPQLFGGGNAYLDLTGDDLLETGVTIMARPPGKRNSNIHLLSGGEKALTAVALVFSIFKLNPAPFCILDEVDAPLDDANVGRFSEMLKDMAEEVQFIFITHNKITMEIAHQLLGVTMQEAGVSRLVSVDVDEAVEMAATA